MNIALIVAGGTGARVGATIPKQFIRVDGREIIEYTLDNISQAECVDGIVLVVHEDWLDHALELIERNRVAKIRCVVSGGATRTDSILCGLRALEGADPEDVVAVIDVNRPLMPHESIAECMKNAKECGCALPLESIYDGVLMAKDGVNVDARVDRKTIFKGQTPETGRYGIMCEIYARAVADHCENNPFSELALMYGYRVMGCRGLPINFKITTREDIELFHAYLTVRKNGSEVEIG